jgi:uncharacterized protein (TIGR01319 family)
MLGCFIDVGSTFTKVRLINLDTGMLLASNQSPTTVDTDVMVGVENALSLVLDEAGLAREEIDVRLASSSAAGGLRMVIVGFSPRYALEAGNRAALGAGAKIVGDFTWYLDEDDAAEIEGLDPDLILLTGGTDGGNHIALPKNARTLADLELSVPVIVAGNAEVSDDAAEALREASYPVTTAENVLASGDGDLNVGDARERIRETFMKHIVDAKGISSVREFVDAELVPTPDAISAICEALAEGTDKEDSLGDLMAVDVGGATTDVHTVGHGHPTNPYVRRADELDEPYRKRTVEGDLGIRYNAPTIRSRFGTEAIRTHVSMPVDEATVKGYVADVREYTEHIPEDDTEVELDRGLASVATAAAAERHAGQLERVDDDTRETFAGAGEAGEVGSDVTVEEDSGSQRRLPTKQLQVGKDLTEFSAIVGTGGILVNSPHTGEILQRAEADDNDSTILLPDDPVYYVDENYIMFACGLMADAYPEAALQTAKQNLKRLH